GADVPVGCARAPARRADRAPGRRQPRPPGRRHWRLRPRPHPGGRHPRPGGGRGAGAAAVAGLRRRPGAGMRALLRWMWPMFRQRWRVLLPACAVALVTAAAAIGLLGVAGWFLAPTALVTGAMASFNLFVPSAMVRGLAFVRILARY